MTKNLAHVFLLWRNSKRRTRQKKAALSVWKSMSFILLTSSKNQIYEFRIPNIYNYFFNNIRLMYTLCFLVASVKLKVYKKVVKFSFKQQKILGIRNS